MQSIQDTLPSRTKFFRLRLKCDGTRAETRFRLSAKRTSPFQSAGASVQSTTGSRGVRISSSNAVYTMFRGSEKSTGYPLHSPVFPSLPLPCVTVCHHISTGFYLQHWRLSSDKSVCHLHFIINLKKNTSIFIQATLIDSPTHYSSQLSCNHCQSVQIQLLCNVT